MFIENLHSGLVRPLRSRMLNGRNVLNIGPLRGLNLTYWSTFIRYFIFGNLLSQSWRDWMFI